MLLKTACNFKLKSAHLGRFSQNGAHGNVHNNYILIYHDFQNKDFSIKKGPPYDVTQTIPLKLEVSILVWIDKWVLPHP